MINKIDLFILVFLFHNQHNYLTHFLSYLNSSHLVSFCFILILFHSIISFHLLDVEVNYGKTKADRERAYDEFGITFVDGINGTGDVKHTMLNPSGRKAIVHGYYTNTASWLNMSLPGEFRWVSKKYRYGEREYSQAHKDVVASSRFQTIMNAGTPTEYYTRVKMFCDQHRVSFDLLTPGGQRSEPRKIGLRNMYLLALSIRLGKTGMFCFSYVCFFFVSNFFWSLTFFCLL